MACLDVIFIATRYCVFDTATLPHNALKVTRITTVR